MKERVALILGSGAQPPPDFVVASRRAHSTRYGEPSSEVVRGRFKGIDNDSLLLFRHGPDYQILPHRINYRANIQALADAGCDAILSLSSVGGIDDRAGPGALIVPDQIIDYTGGRDHSFFSDIGGGEAFIDFTDPYDAGLRATLLEAAAEIKEPVIGGGTYAATQGPRLESAAEVRRIAKDGGAVVGMTGMPEAALARERALPYVCLAVVANRGAGLGDGPLSYDSMRQALSGGMERAFRVVQQFLRLRSL